MQSQTSLSPVELSVLNEAFEVACETLRPQFNLDHTGTKILAKLIAEIGERRVRTGVGLKAEEDVKSVASFAAAILTKSDPR